MKDRVKVLILGGGQGRRLFPLTSYRSKPAVPIGGKYRLVDIPISNTIHAGFRQIFVLTQFNSTSLHRHIHRAYPYEFINDTSIELLAAEQTTIHSDWFQGTADAVRKHLPHYHLEDSDYVLILSGDHLYRMDYRKIVQFHEENNADVTVSTVPVPKREVSGFGIMQIRSDATITAFREKPSPKENIRSFIMPETIRNTFNVKGRPELYLASMGIYVFKAKILKEILAGQETDFGKEIIPKAIEKYKACGYVLDSYWRDIGTIKSFYEANLELTRFKPKFDFLSLTERIYTRPRFLPPAKIFDSQLKNVLMSEGCIIQGATVHDSVIGLRSIIRKGSVIKKTVVMGNDYYSEQKPLARAGIGIGSHCRIENCILDKNVRIGDGVVISNSSRAKEKDGENYYIRDGIVIIPKDVSIRNGTKI